MICANETKSDKTAIQFGIAVIACMVVLAWFSFAPLSVSAQQEPTIARYYTGTLGELHIRLHLTENSVSKVTGTSPTVPLAGWMEFAQAPGRTGET